jgi:hypothetical protein
MKKNLLFIPLLVIVSCIHCIKADAQGCVAIRQMGGCNGASGSSILGKGQWQVGGNYRYFRSHRHYKGTAEQTIRATQGTEVVNYSHSWDANISYGISNRLSANLILPFQYIERSSLYEHGGKERHSTFAGGLADIRLSANYWLFDPLKHQHGNISVGLGLKLPTGKDNVTSLFHNVDGTTVRKVVDQSIQPGDGGFGVSMELQGYQQIWKTLSVYGSAFYLANPRDYNNTLTSGKLPNGDPIYMSVCDQYLTRLGLSWQTPLQGVQLSVGGRFEGVTVHDLLGRSDGFRRPGSVLSIEPGLAWYSGRTGFSVTVPVAMKRNRPQSVIDILKTDVTGVFTNGDAAFADYSLNFSFVYRFGGKKEEIPMSVPHFQDVKH